MLIMLTKTTALILAMTVSVFAPTTVFAQNGPTIPSLVVVVPTANQEVNTETGRNTATNVGIQNQEAENEIEISSEAKASGKYSEAKSKTSVKDNLFFQNIEQTQTQNQVNVINDEDDVDVTAQNAAGGLLAANVNIEDIIVDILGGGGGGG